MQKTRTDKYSKKTVIVFIFILFVMLLCSVRVMMISSDKSMSANSTANSYVITLQKQRKTIFDANMSRLTGTEKIEYSAISPTPLSVTAVAKSLKGKEKNNILERLKSGKPTLVAKRIKGNGILNLTVVKQNENTKANHLLGYIDSNGRGVCGLQKEYDEMLFCEENARLVYSIDGKGRALSGINPRLDYDETVLNSGIAITIDGKIQSVVYDAMNSVSKGAAVVFEVGSCKLRAMVSKPDFDVCDIASSIRSESSPLINRALCAYNVGSVFKPCIAAAALENGLDNYLYTCTGNSIIGGRQFNCNHTEGHGNMNLEDALSLSCNTYFYNLAINCGAKNIYNMAKSFGFGNKSILADGICSQNENLSKLDTLQKYDAAIANYAIGQGDIMLSPLSLGYMYCAIAGNGTYKKAGILEGKVENKKLIENKTACYPTRAISEQTAKTLREYLIKTVESGTGEKARPKTCTAGGKTATAQTGWIDSNNKHILQGWFCGFFPAENPEYVAVVLCEDAVSGGNDSAPIFAEIADGIIAQKH